QLPWNYLLHWIIRTIPLFSIIGILFFLRLVKFRSKDLPFIEIFVLLFSMLFPIVYAIYKHSTLHDGWRHFIFIYPSLLALAATGWYWWFTSFRSKLMTIISASILCLLLAENLIANVTLHPYEYIYFNPFFGGLKKAYGNFETDYWMLSVKEASEWLLKNELLETKSSPIRIATNCYYPASIYLDDSLSNRKTVYTRYYDKSSLDWDYGIFYSRFIDRDQLLTHVWPPKGTIHTIQADGIPICAIVKRENKEDFLGMTSFGKNDFLSAIQHLEISYKYDPMNEEVSSTLATIYKNQCEYAKAEKVIISSLRAHPGSGPFQTLMKEIQYERVQ
ncbi:MAG: tetratricopeptide repeat protein, partial [Saprospiraceae bacterium]